MKKDRLLFVIGITPIPIITGILALINGSGKAEAYIYAIIMLSFALTVILQYYLHVKNPYYKALALLYSKCTPDAFITEMQKLIETEKRKKRPKSIYRYMVNLSKGFYAAGKFQQAMETLENIEIIYHYKNAAFIANYFHNKFLVSLEIERQDIAWGSLVKMKLAIMNIRKHKTQQYFAKLYDEDMYILNVVRGSYEGAEEIFNAMYSRVTTNYERALALFLLGGLYRNLGKEAESKDAYECVLNWGNKLYIADSAKEILGLTSQQE